MSSLRRWIFTLTFALVKVTHAGSEWPQLYQTLFGKTADAANPEVETSLEAKFREVKNPIKTQVAIILMKLDDERRSPKGVWAEWLLDSPLADRTVIAKPVVCAAIQQAAATRLLAKNFLGARQSYERLKSDAECSNDARDFADFQLGWISINQSKPKEAADIWNKRLALITARQAPSIHKPSIVKELTRLAINENLHAVYVSVKQHLRNDADNDAFTEGALESLLPLVKNLKAFSQAKQNLDKDLEPARVTKIYPSTRLAALISPCSGLEWFSKNYDAAGLAETSAKCAQSLVFSNPAEACYAVTQRSIIAIQASKLLTYCEKIKFSDAQVKRWQTELSHVDWAAVDVSNLASLIKFNEIKSQEPKFRLAQVEFFNSFTGTNNDTTKTFALAFLQSEASKSIYHDKVYAKFVPSSDRSKEWQALRSEYLFRAAKNKKSLVPDSLEKLREDIVKLNCESCVAPLLQLSLESESLEKTWQRFATLPPAFQTPELRKVLDEKSYGVLINAQPNAPEVAKFASHSELIKITSEALRSSKIEPWQNARNLVSDSHYRSVSEQTVKTLSQVDKMNSKLTTYVSMNGVEAFVKDIKVAFSLRSKVDSNAKGVYRVIDSAIAQLLREYRGDITAASADSFWTQNPDLARQMLTLVSKWENTLQEKGPAT